MLGVSPPRTRASVSEPTIHCFPMASTELHQEHGHKVLLQKDIEKL